MRTMYDAIHPENIPIWAALVAGYVDGPVSQWRPDYWTAFPNSVMVRIVTNPSNTLDGHVLDVESGDATPEQAPGWVQARRNSGYAEPTIYCSESAWATVREQFVVQGVAEPLWWIAAYPGPGEVLYDDPRCVAHQYGGDTPGGYDLSVVADYWPGVDPAPKPAPTPTPVPPAPKPAPTPKPAPKPPIGKHSSFWDLVVAFFRKLFGGKK